MGTCFMLNERYRRHRIIEVTSSPTNAGFPSRYSSANPNQKLSRYVGIRSLVQDKGQL